MRKILKFFTVIIVLALFISSLSATFNADSSIDLVENTNATATNSDGSLIDNLADLFFPSENVNPLNQQVYLGGYPLGMTIDGNGVTVIGLNEFIALDGEVCCPAVKSGLQINDVVIELNGIKIYNSARLAEISGLSEGKEIEIKYIRKSEVISTKITPQKDLSTKQYRLGLWTKDSSSGVGTLTYIKKNLQFGSLGHPICDNSGAIVETKNGGVYKCKINSILKGQRGAAGELRGGFNFEDRIGSIYTNNMFGVYGNFNKLPAFELQLVDVASVGEVRQGKAQIYCTLDNNVREAFDIEIIKTNNQRSKDDKGMVLRITDSRLLEKTGGIVQGMSGSPIVQNGKLVGAVTHVFVNDPTKGYGMYAEWMLMN